MFNSASYCTVILRFINLTKVIHFVEAMVKAMVEITTIALTTPTTTNIHKPLNPNS